MAETNLNWQTYENSQACKEIFRRYWKQTKIGLTSASCQTSKFYQPGGVGMITGFPWASRTKVTVDESGLGRWVESEITGRYNRKVTIITTYMVCKDSIESSGPNTAFTQQWTILKVRDPHSNPNPRIAAFDDLQRRITTIRRLGNEVILMMDANDTLQNPNSLLTKWTTETGLVDPFIQLLGTEDEPPTHARGSKRIDYILTSEKISEFITSAGILPFHDVCFSDHRALFIDIDLQGYLRAGDPPNINRASRGISSEDPRSVEKYQIALSKALDEANLEQLIEQADRFISIHGYTSEAHSMIEEIDKKFTNIMLTCEKESKTKFRHPWSPKLRDASYANQYWNIWLSQKKQHKDLSYSRQRYITPETAEYEKDGDFSMKFIKFKLAQAQKRLTFIQQNAEEYRKTFMEEQANMYADDMNQSMESTVRRIMFQEQQNQVFNKLKRLRGKIPSAGLDYIICTNEDGKEVRIQDPEEMFTTIIQHNITHFSQADATEITREPLRSILGRTGTNQACEEILKGTFKIEEIDCSDTVKAILRQLKKTIDQDISDVINSGDVQKGYSKWGEFTSTSPSGLHLSHDKAVLRFKRRQQENAEATNTPVLYERFFAIKATLLNWAVQHGHVYKRWTKVVNAMIEKVKGRPIVNKLRVIHLIESDFNLLIGILWGRRLVTHGEQLDLFDDGQGGSRPDRRTQELLIQKHLVYSIWRLAKLDGTSFDNDAKSCFDRIVMPLASLASQQAGMTKQACELFLNTLNQMQYHIKTSSGISNESYGTTDQYTIHGPGQGGRGSPCIWLVVSSLIMKTLKKEQAKGSQMSNPLKAMQTTQYITGFVDDITHWCSNMDYNEQIDDLIAHTTETAQFWSQLLSSTGGKLELQKCFAYLITWIFNQEGISRMANPTESPMNIVLLDSESNEPISIAHKSVYESHKTLGVMECPCGNYKDEYERLMSKSKGFAQMIATTRLSRHEAHTLYFTVYIPSVLYSGAIGTLTERQAEQIQGSVTQQVLAKKGFNRCIPSAIAFGPESLGGVGLRHLFREQGTEKTLFIIRLLRCNRPASRVLRIQLAWAQHVAGISDPILENTSIRLPQLDSESWIETLRDFLDKSQLKVRIVHIGKTPGKCQNDIYLMDAACSSSLSNKAIQRINRCRIYLRAETLSDISTYSGKYLDLNAFECNEKARIRSEKLWPRQPRPGPKHIQTWQTFLRNFCHVGSFILEQPLGKWECQIIPKRSGCCTYVSTLHPNAIRITQDGWSVSAIHRRRTYNTLGKFEPCEEGEPSGLIPADVILVHGKEMISWRGKIAPRTQEIHPTTGNPQEWDKYILQLPQWEARLLENIRWFLPIETIISILQNESKEVIIVSDGGCVGETGSYGWVISNQLLTMIEGHGVAPGEPMSSFRAEAFGKLSWIVFLHHITLFYGIRITCMLQSYCDNKAIVATTTTRNRYESMYMATCPDFDVRKTIAIKQQQLTAVTTNYRDTLHVKAHQDDKKSQKDLTVEEILNIRADELATQVLKNVTLSSSKTQGIILPHAMAYLCIDNDRILSSTEATTLRWRLSEFQLQDYYCQKFGMTRETLRSINWAALRLARNKLSPGQKAFSIKQAIGWLATGSRMQLQGRLLTSCIECDGYEDTDHLFTCPARRNKIDQTLRSFQAFARGIQTDLEIIDGIIDGLEKWMLQKQPVISKRTLDTLGAYKEQDSIGWNLFVRGFIGRKWSAIHESRQPQEDRQAIGDVWCSKICCWWIQKSHEIWTDRNHALHHQSSLNDSWRDREVREQVTQLYEKAPYMDAEDRTIFNTPLDIKLTQPTESLQVWVTTMSPIVRVCIKKQEEMIRRQHRDIRSYFEVSSQQVDTDTTDDNQELSLAHNHDDINSNTTVTTNNLHSIESKNHNTTCVLVTNLPITNISTQQDTENHTSRTVRYLSKPSGEVDPPDRVETPREGDTDRAASHRTE